MENRIGVVLLSIIVGVILLFVGVFILASIEPMFTLDTCSFTNNAADQNVTNLNGSAYQSGLQNYTITTITGTCTLNANVYNISANAPGTLEIYEHTGGTLLNSYTDPVGNSPISLNLTPTAGTDYSLNFTYYDGTGNITILDTSYVRCCSSMVRDTSRIGGRYFDSLVSQTGTIFAVLGLVLIVVGLAMAIGSLKNMM